MKLNILILTIVITGLITISGHAGGSIDFKLDAIPLLQKQPALLQFIQSSLDVAPGGWGVRFGPHGTCPERAGERITPFTFQAKPRGQQGPYTLELIIIDPSGLCNVNDPDFTYIKILPLSKQKN